MASVWDLPKPNIALAPRGCRMFRSCNCCAACERGYCVKAAEPACKLQRESRQPGQSQPGCCNTSGGHARPKRHTAHRSGPSESPAEPRRPSGASRTQSLASSIGPDSGRRDGEVSTRHALRRLEVGPHRAACRSNDPGHDEPGVHQALIERGAGTWPRRAAGGRVSWSAMR